ncbi:MAG: response regulator transcription factor [Clostridia bacterium]|nr:response regulator transcription factor [Oscillospiraceae bacterium]MBQ6263021.1 response regulator transcription factor [Clostridia bacterium]
MKETILLVEDNPHIMEINREVLAGEGYRVLQAADGKTCRSLLEETDVDLIVLDIMLPDADGLALCGEIKARYDIPILFLSALGENAQIIEGLRAGGDDYLPKPYDIGVLVARVAARLRAAQRKKRFVTQYGLRLDTVSMLAYADGRDLLLTQKEFLLLLTLLQSGDRMIGKDELYQTVWGVPPGGDHSALYTTVSRLNKKLDGTGNRVNYHRGEGYILEKV